MKAHGGKVCISLLVTNRMKKFLDNKSKEYGTSRSEQVRKCVTFSTFGEGLGPEDIIFQRREKKCKRK